ncbi:hypothetical protein V6Z12_A09G234200 [Gossypium hirsutum]
MAEGLRTGEQKWNSYPFGIEMQRHELNSASEKVGNFPWCRLLQQYQMLKLFYLLNLPFSSDPGFSERAPRFSSFNGELGFNRNEFQANIPDSKRESLLVSENIPRQNNVNSRKRKSIPREKQRKPHQWQLLIERSKKDRAGKEHHGNGEKHNKVKSKAAMAPMEYVHVRARRGQATDGHSLAERVRREKISERMKLLQDLVPGCNKVTGKALMLDEIINYVQSLQCQVELATLNPRMDINMESIVSMDQGVPMHNGDLHSIVQMGFGQNQPQSYQGMAVSTSVQVKL